MSANRHVGNNAMLSKLVVNRAYQRFRDSKTKPFAASARSNNKSINTHQVPVPVDQRSAAVAGINRGIGLHIHHGTIQFRLSSYRANDSLGDRMVQALGGADSYHSLAQAEMELFRQRNRR